MWNVTLFLWHDEAKSATLGCYSCCSTDSVHILFDLTAQVELNYPSDILEIQTTGSYIGADKDRSNFSISTFWCGLIKSEEVLLSFSVLHITMKLADISVK